MATNKLFVGSLPYSMTDEELNQLFAAHGTVLSAKVIVDRETQRSRGYGFVEMSNEQEAQSAIENLNGHEVNGRAIVVNEARSPEEKKEQHSDNQGGFGPDNAV
ncbi:MAG: RNA-binding protein [Candidatus Saccharimonadales bacterium]|jgi:RNA recognition motif-containing protein